MDNIIFNINHVVGCFGDGECDQKTKKKLFKTIRATIKKGGAIFITRGMPGFEADCAEAVNKIKKNYPNILCYAIKYRPDSAVEKEEFYDKSFCPNEMRDYIKEYHGSLYYSYLANQAKTFILGPITESFDLVIVITETRCDIIDVAKTIMPNGTELMKYFESNLTIKEKDFNEFDSLRRDYYSEKIDYNGYDYEEQY